MNVAIIFKFLTIYNLLTSMDSKPLRVTTRMDKLLSRYKRDLTLGRQFPTGMMGFLMMMLPLLPLALRKSRSFAVLLPIPVPMRNQQQQPIQKDGKSDLMLMMMMMMSMMKNMDGKPSAPWGAVSNWPPPPSGNPWPTQPVKDSWPTTTSAPDPWPSPPKDPWPTTTPTPSDPWSTKPPDPWAQGKPSDPWAQGKPSDPWAKPNNPWETKPSDPWAQAKPSDPWAQAKPTDPWAPVKPSDPWAQAKPSDPWAQAKPSDPWAQAKPSDPWAKPNNPWETKPSNPWEQGKKPNSPWDQWKGGAASLWEQLKNAAGGNPWGQPTGPWDPIDDSKRKSSPDYGDSGQYAEMMNQMANMLKYYMKNMTTTTPAPGGKIEDCPKCNVQVNINNSNASPRHNQTQTTSYGVKKRSKESKVKGNDPAPEIPVEDGQQPPPADGVAGGQPGGGGVIDGAPFDPNNPDQPLPDDPGDGIVDIDGDGFPDPPGQQSTRFGQQRQNLARRRTDKGARRLTGHSLKSPMILPHEPYNGVRYAVPRSKNHENLPINQHQQYSPSVPPQGSSPITGHQILLQPPQSPTFVSPSLVPVVQPGFPGRTIVYTQAVPVDNVYGQQQVPINGPYYRTIGNKGETIVGFVPVGSTQGGYNQPGRQSNGYNQVDDSRYEIIRNSESQRESDYSNDQPKLINGTNRYPPVGSEDQFTTDQLIIAKPILGKPPPTHKAPMEYRAFIDNDNGDGSSSTSFSSSLTKSSSSSATSRMDYESDQSTMETSTSTTTDNPPPVYIQQRSSPDDDETINVNDNRREMMMKNVHKMREPLPSPSASQPKPQPLSSSSSFRTDHNFRSNGPSPLSANFKPNFRPDDRSKQFRSDIIPSTPSNGIKSTTTSTPTPPPQSSSSTSSSSSLGISESIIDTKFGINSTNSSTVFYTFPLSIESLSSSESRFPVSTTLATDGQSSSTTISSITSNDDDEKTKFTHLNEKYNSNGNEKILDRMGQENGTSLWKEISNHINKDNISNYLSQYHTQTDSTFPTTISAGRIINYDQFDDDDDDNKRTNLN